MANDFINHDYVIELRGTSWLCSLYNEDVNHPNSMGTGHVLKISLTSLCVNTI